VVSVSLFYTHKSLVWCDQLEIGHNLSKLEKKDATLGLDHSDRFN